MSRINSQTQFLCTLVVSSPLNQQFSWLILNKDTPAIPSSITWLTIELALSGSSPTFLRGISNNFRNLRPLEKPFDYEFTRA